MRPHLLLHSLLLSLSHITFAFPLPLKLSSPTSPTFTSSALQMAPLPPIPAPVALIGSSTRFTVSSVFLYFTLITRSPSSTTFLILAIATAILNKLLKNILHAPRPLNLPLADPTDHGMPSSHAASLSFIFFTLPYLLPLSPQIIAGLAAYCLISLYYRYLRGLHTLPQLLVGTLLGLASSQLSYKFTPLAAQLTTVLGAVFKTLNADELIHPGYILTLAAGGAAVICAREIKQLKRFAVPSKDI